MANSILKLFRGLWHFQEAPPRRSACPLKVTLHLEELEPRCLLSWAPLVPRLKSMASEISLGGSPRMLQEGSALLP